MQRGLPQKRRIPGVDKVVLVSSAKGGVGKSTVAANIAAAAAAGLHIKTAAAASATASSGDSAHVLHRPLRVGLLDLDLFGPSVPKLLRLEQQHPVGEEGAGPRLTPQNQLIPLTNYGIKSMSMGYLLPGTGSPIAWRGLMVMKAVQQLLWEVDWSPGVDLLVVDMPPGTGDVQLSVGQQVVVDGAVVITTPQDVALVDAVKGVNMFRKMDIPILGLVVNMASFVCSNCHAVHHIFGKGTQKVNSECAHLGINVLGEVPLEKALCRDADDGCPTVIRDPEGAVGRCVGGVVRKLVLELWGGAGEGGGRGGEEEGEGKG